MNKDDKTLSTTRYLVIRNTSLNVLDLKDIVNDVLHTISLSGQIRLDFAYSRQVTLELIGLSADQAVQLRNALIKNNGFNCELIDQTYINENSDIEESSTLLKTVTEYGRDYEYPHSLVHLPIDSLVDASMYLTRLSYDALENHKHFFYRLGRKVLPTDWFEQSDRDQNLDTLTPLWTTNNREEADMQAIQKNYITKERA
jgi:hypothetical protein